MFIHIKRHLKMKCYYPSDMNFALYMNSEGLSTLDNVTNMMGFAYINFNTLHEFC